MLAAALNGVHHDPTAQHGAPGTPGAKLDSSRGSSLSTCSGETSPRSLSVLAETAPGLGPWASYGDCVVLPHEDFGAAMETMDYSINPFMVGGSVSADVRGAFMEDLRTLHATVRHRATCLKVVRPVQAQFPLELLLSGVQGDYLNDAAKRALLHAVAAIEDRAVYPAEFFRANKAAILAALPAEVVANAQRVLSSLGSGVPDAIYLANLGFSLGYSRVLGARVFLVQMPRELERQLENTFGRVVAAELGYFPLEMARIFEGMADLVSIRTRGGERVLLGYDSSRSDARVYEEVLALAAQLDVEDFPSRVEVVEAREKAYGYHQDLAILTVPPRGAAEATSACVGEGILTDASLERLRSVCERVHCIPRAEWMSFALNSILLDERLGAPERTAIIPPDCPAMQRALASEGYTVLEQALAYKHGGGFLRCLTLFGDAAGRPVSAEAYAELAARLPAPARELLRWGPDVHEATAQALRFSAERGLHAVEPR